MSRAPTETETKILDLAESLIRKNGYNGFSFREIASGVGVKSSSVHYYFPTKADLGARVANRYTERFLDGLVLPGNQSTSADNVIAAIHRAFADASAKDGQMCLCGVLAAESAGLPSEVAAEAKAFFERSAGWLSTSLSKTAWGKDKSPSEIERRSLAVLAQLEGGLLIARVQQKPDVFDLLVPELS